MQHFDFQYNTKVLIEVMIFDFFAGRVDIEKELEAADNEKPKEKSKSATQPVIENVIDSTGK